MQSIIKNTNIKCPRCGNEENFAPPKTNYLIPAWLTVGFPTFNKLDSKKYRVQCTKCQYNFSLFTTSQSPLSKFSNIVLFIIAITGLCAVILSNFPEILKEVPDNIIFVTVESFILSNSRLTAICITISVACLSILCFTTSIITNYRYKKTVHDKKHQV